MASPFDRTATPSSALGSVNLQLAGTQQSMSEDTHATLKLVKEWRLSGGYPAVSVVMYSFEDAGS